MRSSTQDMDRRSGTCPRRKLAAWKWRAMAACGLALCSGVVYAAAAQNGGNDLVQDVPGAENPVHATNIAPLPDDGPVYPISEFRIEYVRDNPAHPPVEDLMNMPIMLGRAANGAFVAPRPPQVAEAQGVENFTFHLADAVGRGVQNYYASAVQQIIVTLRDHLMREQLLGIYVAPDPLQISDVGQDLRQAQNGNNPLTLVIATGSVTQVRTLASGERVDTDRWPGIIRPANRVDHPAHRKIRMKSPIRPGELEDEYRSDLLRQDVLDRYLFHLSRHPGRRVDASIAAGEEPGSVILDYQVTENRPLSLYAQLSNTGTEATGEWRGRFGLLHTQVTNNDDIFTFDYITSFFDVNAILASYDTPLFGNDRLRGRIYGNWTEFTADDVGFFGQTFTGESWAIGGEVAGNMLQRREMFIDLFGGLRYENIRVENPDFGITGEENFIIPYVGVRYDRRTDWFATQASVQLEWWLSNADSLELAALGRTQPDENPILLRGGITHSVYLEPLINRKGWEDLSTPKSSTLAHELVLSVRGQYAFDNRLIPQATQVIGGLYTVRGYKESIVSGDSAVIGSAEYRLHIPRLFALEPEPGQLFGRTFRGAPQYVFGPVDWDLVPKVFFDIGRTFITDPLAFESDETLMSVGAGVDLIYRRNLNVRMDWGYVLEDVETPNVSEGSSRFHFVATILF